jgi:hypothetical protein
VTESAGINRHIVGIEKKQDRKSEKAEKAGQTEKAGRKKQSRRK